jgi:hypothetical protein
LGEGIFKTAVLETAVLGFRGFPPPSRLRLGIGEVGGGDVENTPGYLGGGGGVGLKQWAEEAPDKGMCWGNRLNKERIPA